MRVLVGECTGPKWLARIRPLAWGRMFVEKRPTPYEGEPWGYDNGAWLARSRSLAWDPSLFRRRLDRVLACVERGATPPLLCVVPDIWGEGARSLELSLSWIDELPHSLPWYLPIQDGMRPSDVEPHLEKFDGLFLGGSDRYRNRSAWRWIELAHARGLGAHVGRCGSPRSWAHAQRIGADSCDSSTPLRQNDRFERFARAWSLLQLGREQLLPFTE